jgi:ABC-type antimicrobial peptide transport system permease subunit
MDLGRLGEECVRFKEMFSSATSRSLLLLNETFSTTSFEEGYYIARDSVKALLTRSVRTIYNTHMHKLGEDADEFVIRQNSAERQLDLMTGEYGLANAHTYTEYQKQMSVNVSDSMLLSVMGTFIALLLLNVVLGTLGTFWLQIRKRTEDIGIMRSFGAKRSNVFWMLW